MTSKDPVVLNDVDKGWLLASLDLKRQQIQRSINAAPAGSSIARALSEDAETVRILISKVGLL